MSMLDRISVDPEVCLGQPTIRGMRITVALLLKLFAAGMSRREILDAYPELEDEDITQALKYAAWSSSERTRLVPLKGAAGGGS